MSEIENSSVIDLWGNVVYSTKGKRGRPPFKWTRENSNKVNMLLSMGWTNERIAGAVIDPRTGKSICVATLKRHFRAELKERDHARDRLIARQLEVAANAAFVNGNVGAMRFLQVLVEKNDVMSASDRLRNSQDAPAEKALGKKEMERRAAAEAVSGDNDEWGADLRPGYSH